MINYEEKIKHLENELGHVNLTEYLLIDNEPEMSKDVLTAKLIELGELYFNYADEYKNINLEKYKQLLLKSCEFFKYILHYDFENNVASKYIYTIFTLLSIAYQNQPDLSCEFLKKILDFSPTNVSNHYNLGFIYYRLNDYKNSIYHYKLAIALSDPENKYFTKQELKDIRVKSYNGMATVLISKKLVTEAIYYLKKAKDLDFYNPDTNNKLGVAYTEARRTDLAEESYLCCINAIEQNKIQLENKSQTLSQLYMNYGHMHSYNGNDLDAINCYDKSLVNEPTKSSVFSNKLMALPYFFDEFLDKMYITQQHFLINKLFYKLYGNGDVYSSLFKRRKIPNKPIVIGLVSGDFFEHPVSRFIKTFIDYFGDKKKNGNRFSLILYSTGYIPEDKKHQFKNISGLDTENCCKLIIDDNVDILFDLSGHTAKNKLDVFYKKPAPIQISYLGYPFTTGLKQIDYRITDNFCDNLEISQPFYSENLKFLSKCFLNYTSQELPELVTPDEQPFLKNGYLTIGCFNRINKISNKFLNIVNNVLKSNDKVKFLFKTKALLNKKIQDKFLNNFDSKFHNKILIKSCNLTEKDHLTEYNNIDISIDTFPYSGTTTSCESLSMGVPVLSLYDTKYYFHPQNVTCSILKNSNLDWFVCNNEDDFYNKINDLTSKNDLDFWYNFKKQNQQKFINGNVCNKELYIKNMTELLLDIYNNHKI